MTGLFKNRTISYKNSSLHNCPHVTQLCQTTKAGEGEAPCLSPRLAECTGVTQSRISTPQQKAFTFEVRCSLH